MQSASAKNESNTTIPPTLRAAGYQESKILKLISEGKDPREGLGYPARAARDLISNSLALYKFTTENIAKYLPLLNATDKRCLSIAASGDQAISLLMAGAKEVVTFDSVSTAGEVTWLKMQALADLDWKDRGEFSWDLWKKALDPLNFANLIDRARGASFGQGRSTLRNAVCGLPKDCAPYWVFPVDKIDGTVPYLRTDEAFQAAKKACQEAVESEATSFVHSDIRMLPLLSLGEFDVIVLSNVLQAALDSLRPPQAISRTSNHQFHNKNLVTPENLNALVNSMIWPIAHMLSPGGIMMASYTYDCDTDFTDGEIYDPPLRTSPLQGTISRRKAFTPLPGFTVDEHWGDAMNTAVSGVDVMVMIRRDA